MENSVVVHPDSLRAMAMQLQQAISGGAPTDDTVIGIRAIEAECIAQYGLIIGKTDKESPRLGQSPDPARLLTRELDLLPLTAVLASGRCRGLFLGATLPTYVFWNGKPYITGVGTGVTSFMPVDFVDSLVRSADQGRKSTYCVQGNQLITYHLAQTMAVRKVRVTGVLANPLVSADVNDPIRWQVAWAIASTDWAVVKERAEIRLKGGAVATFQRKDQTNNGTDNAINKP